MKKRILGLALAMLLLFCAAALGETNTQVKHYLMLGEDGYADQVTDDARTDTIVLVSLDTKYNRVILTSILRDSKISNPRGNETKINLLYKNHGFDGIVSCLERELDIEIEGAILVNFENVYTQTDAIASKLTALYGTTGHNTLFVLNNADVKVRREIVSNMRDMLAALIAANPQIKNPNLIYPGDQAVSYTHLTLPTT